MAVDVSPGGNVLEITSDGAGDHVEVRQNAANNFAVDVVVNGGPPVTRPLGVLGTIVFRGNGGNDTFINNTYNPTAGYSRAATAYGDAGTDWLQGNDRNDVLVGGTGNDTLTGGAGNDTLSGEAGDDHLYGDEGHDFLVGGGDNDTLYGHAGNDLLYGLDGGDLLDRRGRQRRPGRRPHRRRDVEHPLWRVRRGCPLLVRLRGGCPLRRREQ